MSLVLLIPRPMHLALCCYHDFIESLKQNKDIKGLPRYVAEHVLPVLERKTDQTVKKALEVLEVKYG